MLPIFLAFLWSTFEVGHIVMVKHMVQGAARTAARHGTTEDVTNSDVQATLTRYLDSTLDTSQVTIQIKDASMIDSGAELPETPAEWNALSDVNVDQLETRQLFAVRATVPVSQIVYLPLPFTNGIILEGVSLVRHE